MPNSAQNKTKATDASVQGFLAGIVDGTSRYAELTEQLGPCKLGKVCLYIKRLADVDMAVLEQVVRSSYDYVMARQDNMHRAQ